MNTLINCRGQTEGGLGSGFSRCAAPPEIESFSRLARQRRWRAAAGIAPAREQLRDEHDLTTERKQIAVLQMINAYRFLGVRHADLDPLKHQEKPHIPELDPAYYGLDRGGHEYDFWHRFVDRSAPRIACGKFCAYCGKLIAAVSASSICTLPIPSKNGGYKIASKVRAHNPITPLNTNAIFWNASMRRKGWKSICIHAMSGRNAFPAKAAKA